MRRPTPPTAGRPQSPARTYLRYPVGTPFHTSEIADCRFQIADCAPGAYSLQVRGWLGAGSRSALPLRFSVKRRVYSVSMQHRSFLLTLLLPAFLLVSAFAVVQAQNAGSPAARRWSDP